MDNARRRLRVASDGRSSLVARTGIGEINDDGERSGGWAEANALDLGAKLDGPTASRSVRFEKSKGRAGRPENERCDELAVQEWKKIRGER